MPTTPDSPLVSLVRQHMAKRGMDRKALALSLSSNKNANKTHRCIDQLLRGERIIPDFVQRVVEALQIPPEQLAVAREAH